MMNLVKFVFSVINLCSLMCIINSSNPDSEIVQSSNDKSNEKNSAPLTDYRSSSTTIQKDSLPENQSTRKSSTSSNNFKSNPRVIFNRDNSDRDFPEIIVTTIRIPFRAYNRMSQRFPLVSGFSNVPVKSFVTRDRNRANNNNRNVAVSNNVNFNKSSNPSRLPSRNRTIIQPTASDSEQKPNSFQPQIPPVNEVSSFSIPSRNNEGNIPQNRPVYYIPISQEENPNNSSNIRFTNNEQRNQGNWEIFPRDMPTRRPYPQLRKKIQSNQTSNSTSDQKISGFAGDSPRRNHRLPQKSSESNRRSFPDANFFAGIVNDFAFDLARISNMNKNFVISPLSIFMALSMCYLGSEGSTKSEIEEALKLNRNSVHGYTVHQNMRNLASLISPKSEDFQMFLANGFFVGKNFTVTNEFVRALQMYYAADLRNIDFGDVSSSVQSINDWVSQNTRNAIPSLLNGPLPPLTRLILLNAVYFKGVWNKQFPINGTFEGRFSTLDGNSKQVPLMTLYNEKFSFYKSDEHRHSFIQLPYKGKEISMIIALPYDTRNKPMPVITDEVLCKVRDAMKETFMDFVAIPKFRLEFSQDLKNPLKTLGIRSIFSESSADLSKMRKEKDMYVSDILHKAIVEVNEEGTVASATTAVNLVPLTYRNTTDFVVDHPFSFYIVHDASGLVLFHGQFFDVAGE